MSMSDLGGSFGPPAPVEAPPQRDRARDLHEHVARTLKLAFPIILARMGMPLIFLVDTVMVARAGTIELAYFGLAVAPQFLILMTSVGFMQGVMILVSHANGAKHFAACGMTWHIGLLHALVLGSVFSTLSLFTQDFLLLVGQSPDLVAGADRAVWAFSWGVTGQLFFMCTTYFLEATGRPGIGVIAILVGNILNVVLNFVLIYGWGDLVSPMGAAGAAHATSVVRWCMFLIVLSYLIYDSRRNKDRFHVRIGLGEFVSLIRGFGGPVGVRLRRLGTPIALAMGLEAAAMATMILLAGYLGAVALAAHQIAINSIMLAFMVAIGTGGATAVRVGNAVGRFDPEGMRRAGWTGVCLGGLLMAPAALIFALAPDVMAHIYTSDPAAVLVGGNTLRVAGYALVIDSLMAVLLNALRGAGDVIIPMVVHILAFWVFVIPAGWYFAFVRGLGAPGLMWGLFVGVSIAAVALALHFHMLTRHGAGIAR